MPTLEIIDLCSTEGHVKELSQFPDDNASQFFTERELCLVVKVSGSPSTSFAYTPLLTEYSTNQEFLGDYMYTILHNYTYTVHTKPYVA